MWPQMSEYFSENGIQPKPDPIEGIGNLALVAAEISGGYIGCGAHGQGVMEVHNPNLAQPSDFNIYFSTNSYVFRVESHVTCQVRV